MEINEEPSSSDNEELLVEVLEATVLTGGMEDDESGSSCANNVL